MDAQTLREVMQGNLPNGGYTRLIDGYNNAMRAANINNVRRAAMFAAQLGHESSGLRDMREIASGAEYEGRTDLGNTFPGDGVRYAGRGPIQLTGRNNYRAFTRWAKEAGHSNIDFEAEPHRLEEPHWGFLAAAWYWTVARPRINAMCDAGDIVGVTRAINGGTNGINGREARYNRALSFGERLLPDGGKPVVEKIIDYPRDQVAQDTFYNCGPASTQTVIRGATGSLYTERELAGKLGTTQNGTDWIGQFPPVLNSLIPGADYRTVEMPNDPPSSEQKERLWSDIVNSVNAGHGVIANIVAPPSNYPRAVFPSTIHPKYSGGVVYHYFALMGYRDDGNRAVWVADSGFEPYGYFISLDQLATLIPPKGYAYSAAQPKNEGKEEEMTFKMFTDFIKGYFGPQFEAIQEIWRQLRGPHGKGWPQLGKNAAGENLTMVDALAATRQDVAELRALFLTEMSTIKKGK